MTPNRPGAHLSPDRKAEIVRWVAAEIAAGRTPLVSDVAARFASSRNTVKPLVDEAKALAGRPAALPTGEPTDPPGPAGEAPRLRMERDESPDTLRVTFDSDAEITTLDQAVARSGADLSVWRVKDWGCKGWQVPMKVRQGQDEHGRARADVPIKTGIWLIRVEFERILPRAEEDRYAAIVGRMVAHAPKYDQYRPRSIKKPHALECDLFDVHFGKLAWRPEAGDEYDLKTAERVFREAVEDLFDRARGYEFDEAILPIGNDFLHIDGPTNATTAGTVVDTDSRFAKVLHAGQMALVWAVEELRKRVDRVKVVGVSGNHDEVTTLHNARFLWAWFRNAGNVDVDTGPSSRKYHKYGQNLIGYSHGDKVRASALPTLMMQEAKALYAETDYQEIHCGHFHKSKQYATVPVDTHDGIIVRYLHALSARDRWHMDQGFFGGRRAAEGFVWSPDEGLVSNLIVPLRKPA